MQAGYLAVGFFLFTGSSLLGCGVQAVRAKKAYEKPLTPKIRDQILAKALSPGAKMPSMFEKWPAGS